MKRKPGYITLLALAALLLLGALWTVQGSEYVYRASILGYQAHCPFAPISTAICAVLAIAVFGVAQRFFTEKR